MSIEYANNNENLHQAQPEWHKSDYYRITVSTRLHDEVLPDLMLSEKHLTSGLRVLDVGAGFSDTVDFLNSKYRIKGTAVDPVYEVLDDSVAVSEKDIFKVISKKYGKWVILNTSCSKSKEIYIPNKESRLVESVYSLEKKIQPESVDLIISNRLMEHIDLSIALPKMVQVLKSDGEIRFSGCLLNTNINKNELYSGCVDYDGGDGCYSFLKVNGFSNAMNYAQDTGLNVYIVTTGFPHRSEIRNGIEGEIHMGGLMIIRKDKLIPVIDDKLSSLKNKIKKGITILGNSSVLQKLYRVAGKPDYDNENKPFGFEDVRIFDLVNVK